MDLIWALFPVLFSTWLLSVTAIHEFGSHRWKYLPQLHHAYYGMALVLWPGHLPLWVRWVGMFVLADDAFQHAWQAITGQLDYRSPLHLMARYTVYEWWARIRKPA